jgi:AP-1-like transcription factor
MKYTPTDFLATFGVHHSGDNESAHILLDPPPTTNNNGNGPSSPSLDPKNPVSVHYSLPAPLISSQGSFTPSAHKISISPLTGNRLLSSGATWDYIQAHPLFKKGLVDIADVSEKLKGKSGCDGTGPAFEEECVDKAIRESAALAKDELI